MKLLKCKLANAEPGEKLLKKRGFHGYERGGGVEGGKVIVHVFIQYRWEPRG